MSTDTNYYKQGMPNGAVLLKKKETNVFNPRLLLKRTTALRMC